MKKCPKCGTILDDSKKTCYMCGTKLLKSNFSRFGDTFDSQIGATTIEENQENVFEEKTDINSFKEKDVVNNNESSSIDDSLSSSFFSDDLNHLNSLSFDERSDLKKDFDSVFKNKDNFKNKKEVSKTKEDVQKKQEAKQKKLEEQKEKKRLQKEKLNQEKLKNLAKKQEEKEKRKQEREAKQQEKEEIRRKKQEAIKQRLLEEKQRKEEEKKNRELIKQNVEKKSKITEQQIIEETESETYVQKPEINWGDKLSKQTKDISSKEKNNHFALIFNIACISIFIIILLFGYFHFFKQSKKDGYSLGGLHYKVADDFKLKSEDSGSRYYTYKESCALRVTYGPINDVDSYIDNYLNGIKEQFENDKDSVSQFEEIKVNDNVWSGLSILNILEDNSSSTGYQTIIRYKYVSIIYKGNFYHTVYVNPSNDKMCTSMYNDFISSLTFE